MPCPSAGRFFEALPWRFIITGTRSATLTFLDPRARERKVQVVRSGPRTAEMVVRSDDPEINIVASDTDPFLDEGDRLLYGFRDECNYVAEGDPPWVCRFGGIIMEIEDVGAPESANTRLVAYDPWKLLYHRAVLDGATNEISISPAGITYGEQTGDYIILAQLDAMLINATAASTTLPEAGLDWGQVAGGAYYQGTIETTEVIDQIDFQRGVSVGELLDMLVATGTVDVVMTPIYDPFNRPGIVAELSIYNRAGTQRNDAIFGYDLFPKNVVGISRLDDGNLRANQIQYYSGQGGPKTLLEENAASLNTFGVYIEQRFWPGQKTSASIATVQTLARRSLALLADGQRTYQLTPSADRAPIPLLEYDVGDTVPFYSSSRLRAPESTYLRIEGIPIEIDDDQLERVAQLLVTKDADIVLSEDPPEGTGGFAPMLIGGSGGTDEIILYFDTPLLSGTEPPTTDFQVEIGGVLTTVTDVTIDGQTVILTIADSITPGDVVEVDFVGGIPLATGFGIAHGSLIGMSSGTLDTEFNESEAHHSGWARFDADWSTIETSIGVYDWTFTDSLVTRALARGINVCLNLAYTPGLSGYRVAPGSDNKYEPTYPVGVTAYANFAAAAVARYRPMGVYAYELWNEPNISSFWKPTPSASNYSRLVKAAYPAMKALYDDIIVLAGATAPNGGSGSGWQVQFLTDCLDLHSLAGYFDAWSHHPYPGNNLPSAQTGPWGYGSTFLHTGTGGSLRSVLDARGLTGVRIWGTEFGLEIGNTGATEADCATVIEDGMIHWRTNAATQRLGPLFVYSLWAQTLDDFDLLNSDTSDRDAAPLYLAQNDLWPSGLTGSTLQDIQGDYIASFSDLVINTGGDGGVPGTPRPILTARMTGTGGDNGDGVAGRTYHWLVTTSPNTPRINNGKEGRYFVEGERWKGIFGVYPHGTGMKFGRVLNWHDMPFSGYSWGSVSPVAQDIGSNAETEAGALSPNNWFVLEYAQTSANKHTLIPLLPNEWNFVFADILFHRSSGIAKIWMRNSARGGALGPLVNLSGVRTLNPNPTFYPGVQFWQGLYLSSGYNGVAITIDHMAGMFGPTWQTAWEDTPVLASPSEFGSGHGGSSGSTYTAITSVMTDDILVPDEIAAQIV